MASMDSDNANASSARQQIAVSRPNMADVRATVSRRIEALQLILAAHTAELEDLYEQDLDSLSAANRRNIETRINGLLESMNTTEVRINAARRSLAAMAPVQVPPEPSADSETGSAQTGLQPSVTAPSRARLPSGLPKFKRPTT